jgi:hypothetical protein
VFSVWNELLFTSYPYNCPCSIIGIANNFHFVPMKPASVLNVCMMALHNVNVRSTIVRGFLLFHFRT